jgi:hypothetical protein
MYFIKASNYFILFLMLIGLSFNAQAFSKQEAGVVINLAGKQRMLTQKMSKEILQIAKGVDADGAKASLAETAGLFDQTLQGLINGDATLGLPKTEDAAIISQLNKVSDLWAGFKPNVDAALSGTADAAVLGNVAEQNIPLLKNMNEAVQMYAKASGSDLDPGMATTINLAGKQRMLTQKMTKELLLIANGIDADGNKTNLTETAGLFERTLTGLVDGDKELGLPGTEDSGIIGQLEIVKKLWSEYKPVLDAADVSDAALQSAATLNLPLLKEMNKAVKMFEESIK